jgi:hypothetical protein
VFFWGLPFRAKDPRRPSKLQRGRANKCKRPIKQLQGGGAKTDQLAEQKNDKASCCS